MGDAPKFQGRVAGEERRPAPAPFTWREGARLFHTGSLFADWSVSTPLISANGNPDQNEYTRYIVPSIYLSFAKFYKSDLEYRDEKLETT